MGLLHLGRRRRRRAPSAEERWPIIPFSVPSLCVRQLLLAGITLWAAWPLPVAKLTAATVQPAIRQFLVRFLPPTTALHLVAASYEALCQPAVGEPPLLSAVLQRAVAVGLALPLATALYSWAAVMFGIPFVYQSAATMHWACLMAALTAVPMAAVAGTSGVRYRRVLLLFRANGEDELSIAAATYGALIGTWLGAWPLPLDWGTAWQDWPNACALGAVAGYMAGLLASVPLAIQQRSAIAGVAN